MLSSASQSGQRVASTSPTIFERTIGAGAAALLVAVLLALARGRAHWGDVSPWVWLHLAALVPALTLTAVLMWRRRGDRRHRVLGWTWAVAMAIAALASINIRFNTPGELGPIHLLTALTLLLVPAIVLSARSHRVRLHRWLARITIVLALLIAGVMTFPFGRMLGRWLLG